MGEQERPDAITNGRSAPPNNVLVILFLRMRSKEEVELWMERCPVKRSAIGLLSDGNASQAQLDEWARETTVEMAYVVAAAKASPWPKPSKLFENVYRSSNT